MIATGNVPSAPETNLIVTRVPLHGGDPVSLGAANTSEGNDVIFMRPSTLACVSDTHVFASNGRDGIFGFPLAGGPTTRDTGDGLPSSAITALAFLDGRLYAAMSDGYLARIDPATKTCDVLASSRRKDKRSPFDDGKPFEINWMLADPPRHRVLLFINGRNSATHRNLGLWQIDESSGHITPLLRLESLSDCWWGSGVRDGAAILCIDNGQLTGVRFDLSKNVPSVFYSSEPGAWIGMNDGLDRSKARFFGHYPFFGPYVELGDTLWSGNPWSQIGTGRGSTTNLPRLDTDERAGPGSVFRIDLCLEPLDNGKQLLAGNSKGLWLISR